ncbi:MAG: 2OG-Fe(II) oxygenase [Bacillota bacterium]
MSTVSKQDKSAIPSLAERLTREDWVVWEGFLPTSRVAALTLEMQALRAVGAFRGAGVGRDAQRHTAIRGDEICWLENGRTPEAERLLHEELEALRLAVNAATYLGLQDFEGHYAVYPAGASYERHVDGFREGNRRVVSLAIYLNENWDAVHGGALRLFPAGKPPISVMPTAGTLACFLSERVPHEVLPATRARLSLTGWFRRRA